MIYKVLLPILAAALIALGVAAGGVYAIVLGWIGVTAFAVAVLYFIGAHRALGKRLDGTVGSARWAFLPYLAIARGIHEILWLRQGDPASHEIAPGLFVGRRPRRHELPTGVTLVVDMCNELPASRGITTACDYVCIPTLDAMPPTQDELARAVAAVLAAKGPVLVHCAAGHSRSAMVAILAAVKRGTWPDLETAEEAARSVRPGIRLNAAQRSAARRYLGGDVTK